MTDRTQEVTAFASAAEFTGVTTRDRSGWLALRKTMLTASDVAPVLDLDDSKYRRSALAVYVEKTTEGVVDPIDMPPAEVAAMPPKERDEHLKRIFNDARFWGSRLEQPILQTVAEYSGWRYREGGALLRSRKYPWLGCTLDGEVDLNGDSCWSIIEGKTTVLLGEWDEATGKLPGHVLVQAQTQLLVTEAPYNIVFALLQGNLTAQILIEPDREFHSIIVEESERFMDRIREQRAPDPDWRQSSTEALHRLHPDDDGRIVDLPGEAVEWTREIQAAAVETERLKRRCAHLRNQLRHRIGDAKYGVLLEPVGGKSCWRWSKNKAGQRVLMSLKRRPAGARTWGGNESPVANDPLTAQLEASLENDAVPAAPIRFGKRRRTAR